MRCIAILEADRPGIDSVIIWEQAERLVAFAYEHGRVKMIRPLDTPDLDAAIREVCDAFQIADAQLTRIHQWGEQAAPTQRIVQLPHRWE